MALPAPISRAKGFRSATMCSTACPGVRLDADDQVEFQSVGAVKDNVAALFDRPVVEVEERRVAKVAANALAGGRRQGDDHRRRIPAAPQAPDHVEVIRTEIVAPLADAMSLIDRQHADLGLL